MSGTRNRRYDREGKRNDKKNSFTYSFLYDWNDSFRKIPKVAVAKGDSYYDIREQFAST